MLVTGFNAMLLLVELGVVSRSNIVKQCYRSFSLAGRNNLYAITCNQPEGYVIKQFLEGEAPSIRYNTEKRFYIWTKTLANRTPTPRLEAYDDEAQLIVLSYCDGTRPIDHLIDTSDDSGIRVARAILAGLSDWHSSIASASTSECHDFDNASPSILSGIDSFIESLIEPSPAQLEVGHLVSQARNLSELPQLCSAVWRGDRIYHGDLKLSNILLREDGRLWFLDTESSGKGDLAWDAAGIIQSVVALAAEDTQEGETRDSLDAIQSCLDEVTAGLLSLEAFVEDRNIMQRVHLYCCLRLVQTAIEYAASFSALPAACARLLQASSNLRLQGP